MARCRFLGITVLSVVLAATQLQTASAQNGPGAGSYDQTIVSQPPSFTARNNDSTCVVYPLSGLGTDPNLAKWIAETIPEVVEPATWSQTGGSGRIRYFAPSQVLVVNHTPAVHAKVDIFLKDLRKAMPPAKLAMPLYSGEVLTEMPRVVHAQFTEPARPVAAAAAGSTYLVPPPLSQPKHLFHLVIRYEGDGASDGSVSGLLKDLASSSTAKEDTGEKPNPGPAKSQSLKELLHIIVRYEGDGIIDANVVALMKDYFDAAAAKSAPSASYSNSPPPTQAPAAQPAVTLPPSNPPAMPPLPAPPLQAPTER
jgi:hypothetical protein